MVLQIRLASASDAGAIADIYRPYVEDTHFTFEQTAPDAGEIAARLANPLHPWFVAEADGRVIGFASTSAMRARAAYRWSVETGIYLASGALGRGIGAELVAAHLELLERQGFVTVIAGIALPNEPSVALHEKFGFTLSGIERGVGFKLGRWIDVSRWQRDLSPRPARPAEPIPFLNLPRPSSASYALRRLSAPSSSSSRAVTRRGTSSSSL